jgi:hypothetical protein
MISRILSGFGCLALTACVGAAPGDPVDEDVASLNAPPPAGAHVKVCNATALNQRSGPGTTYSVLRTLPADTEVVVIATQGNWVRNDWNGNIGWSSGAYLCPAGGGSGSGSGIWVPAPKTTWQWQLTGTVNENVNVKMIDIDLFDSDAALVTRLENKGMAVICYFSAGSYENWRPDAGQFPTSVLGNPMDGWPGERWLDVKRRDILIPIMAARMDLAVQKGCTGVEPDNVDVWTNNGEAGLSVTANDQLLYNRALATAAHARGLSIALKNDGEQASQLVTNFDFSINEQCVEWDDCADLMPFINANKAVFNCEYNVTVSTMCAETKPRQFSSIKKSLSLGASFTPCPP